MKNLWIFVAVVASFGVYAKVQAADIYDDYYNYEEFDELQKLFEEDFNENAVSEKTDATSDLKVQEEIQQLTGNDKEIFEKVKGYVDDTDGFQLEDNRFQSKEIKNDGSKEVAVESISKSENGGSIEDDGQNIEDIVENRLEPDDPNAPDRNEDYALLWGDDSVAPLPVPGAAEEDENKSIFDETKQILEENDVDDFEEEIKKAIEKDDDTKPEEISPLADAIEETKQILAESDDSFDNISSHSDVNGTITTNSGDIIYKNQEENVEDKVEEDDTVDKVYADLNEDLEKLFETLNKLKNDNADSSTDNNINNNKKENDDFSKNIEVADSDDDSEENEKVSKEIIKFFEVNNFDSYNLDGNQEKAEDNNNDDVDLDKLLENILSEDDLKAENSAAEVFEPLINDVINEPNPDDDMDNYAESVDGELENIDNFNFDLSEEVNKNKETSKNSENSNTNNKNGNNVSVEKEVKTNTKLVEDLNSSELEDLVSQFSILHGEDLNVHSKAFEKNVVPVHITLKVDEPTVVTSPNYPSPYPTNNIVDWILEGPGKGVELNITNFMLNGALGDYLIIKPGGVDETGHDGLLFTYRLASERRFRFTDVDRVFMRFESKPGMSFMRGFSISAKMLDQIASDPEPIPEPEPVVSPPHSTATVALALPVPDFDGIKEEFRQILADMAEQYMNDNNIEFGLNTTSEVTNITRVRLCPTSWPDYESCTAATFAVSLVYEHEDSDPRLNEDDLKAMWTVYSKRDPFALRLATLGVSEFYGPDSDAITTWLLIAAGVILSMIALAFVLWRYSCFEGYTRMKTNSDTDSFHIEKRNLDLYPTPHQNLPPLYAENEYKWPEDDTTKVDVGGFANRSYARDMYDFDSDEDVMTPRDRKGAVTAKDYSSNV